MANPHKLKLNLLKIMYENISHITEVRSGTAIFVCLHCKNGTKYQLKDMTLDEAISKYTNAGIITFTIRK